MRLSAVAVVVSMMVAPGLGLTGVGLAGCGDDDGGSNDDGGTNPGVCDGVDCGDHGSCVDNGGVAECDCDAGHIPQGLTCVPGDPCEGVTCSGHGTCVDNAGTAECQCEAGYHALGLACMEDCGDPATFPFLADCNFDAASSTITGFPAVISYADGAATYAEWVGQLHDNSPVGACEVVDQAFLGVAPALRCTFTATYEDATDPSVGGDPYGYGQTYLGPGSVIIDPALGEVTALSIGFVWQFGAGWLEAMRYRQDHQFDMMWGPPYETIEVTGSGAKPLVTHRENCEYWFDVTAELGADSGATFSGTLQGPDGITDGSVEIHGAGGEVLRQEGGDLLSSTDNQAVGTLDLASGAYSFTLNNPLQSGDTLTAYYRTEPDGGGSRFQDNGQWRLPTTGNGCRERPMMLARPLATDPSYDTLAAMGLTMGDDIACYCYDYHDGQCHNAVDVPANQEYVQFRIGDSQFDDPTAGVYHVGVAEPLWMEMVIDTVNGVLDLYATSPDGRFNDTLISHSSFCDSPDNSPDRQNPNPHRWGNIVWLGDPFYTLPLTTVPADCWHQMGQFRYTAAVNGDPLTRQGPPAGFLQ